MNLRVDLILESEQRSASVVNLKSILRIASICVPVILVVFILSAVVKMMALKSEFNMLEGQMENAVAKQEAAAKLREELATNLNVLNELEGWRNSHIDWHKQLLGLQKEVPKEIQLSALKLSQTLDLIESGVAARVFTMVLEGNAVGEDAEYNVYRLKRRLENTQLFSSIIEEDGVKVAKYASNPEKGAHKTDRIFRIECLYQDRKFE